MNLEAIQSKFYDVCSGSYIWKVQTSEKLTASLFFSQQPAWVPNKDPLMGGLTGTLQGARNTESTRPRQVIFSVGQVRVPWISKH